MEDLHLGHRPALVVGQPRLAVGEVARDLVRHPAVAVAEHADEVRPRALDLREADRQHGVLRLLLVGDAPAQVDLAPHHAALLAEVADLGEDALHELLALALHVAEGRRDEDAQDARCGGHATCSSRANSTSWRSWCAIGVLVPREGVDADVLVGAVMAL